MLHFHSTQTFSIFQIPPQSEEAPATRHTAPPSTSTGPNSTIVLEQWCAVWEGRHAPRFSAKSASSAIQIGAPLATSGIRQRDKPVPRSRPARPGCSSRVRRLWFLCCAVADDGPNRPLRPHRFADPNPPTIIINIRKNSCAQLYNLSPKKTA